MTLTIYSKNMCPFCDHAKNYLKQHNIPYEETNIEHDADARNFVMSQGHRTVPQIYLNGEIFVAGGWEGLSKMNANEIKNRLFPTNLGNL